MPQLPTPFRAALGLAAEAVDQARHLPDRAIELPMLAVSTALQLSLRAQQRYALLAARGDELLNRHEPGDEPPAWATFDDEAANAPLDLTAVEGGLAEPAAPPRKRVRRPRNGAPSPFDAVGDE